MRHVDFAASLAKYDPGAGHSIYRAPERYFLASIIGYVDLTKAAQIVNNREIRPFELYLFIAIVYWLCSYAMSRYAGHLEHQLASR
jgi:polar amino acid transport system permease protein